MMTLDEAIFHAEEVAKKNELKAMCVEEAYQTAEQSDCETCASQHYQLAEWLKDYQTLLKYREHIESVFTPRVLELLSIELACIKFNDGNNCDRKCKTCSLVQDSKELIILYETLISLAKEVQLCQSTEE